MQDTTLTDLTVDETSGGFSPAVLGIVMLLAGVPVLLAMVLSLGLMQDPAPVVQAQADTAPPRIAPAPIERTTGYQPTRPAARPATPEVISPTLQTAPEASPTDVYDAVTEFPLEIDLLTPRGVNPVYQVSERFEFTVDLSESAYLYCYYQDGAGTIARIFPNRFQPEAFVEVDQPLRIPGADARFNIVFELPGTLEAVDCFAADQDVDLALPDAMKTDLVPVPVSSLEQVAAMFSDNASSPVARAQLQISVN